MGYNTTITNEGAALLASVIANQGTITFTEMRFSGTDYKGSEATLTEGTFGGTFVTASAAASVVDSTTIKVAASFNNSGIVSAHPLYSIGVIGTDGNDTALIAVCTTSDPEATIRPPVPATSISTYAFNTNLTVSSTSNITVAGTTAAALYETDVVDNLISTATNKPLSANQGRVLKGNIDDNFSGQSNENLLINPFFTINQRGVTSGTFASSGAYHMDRWYGGVTAYGNLCTWSLTSSGLTLDNSGGATNPRLAQPFPSLDATKIYTVSVLFSDGTIESMSGKPTLTFTTTKGIKIVFYAFQFEIWATSSAVTIRAAKLELGSVSTLANDVEPDKTLETLACQKADFSQIAYQNLDETTARKAYRAGQYFFNADGELCRAKVAISSGQTLTEGTNFEKKVLTDDMVWTDITSTVTRDTTKMPNGNIAVYKRQGFVYVALKSVTFANTGNAQAVITGLPPTLSGDYPNARFCGTAMADNSAVGDNNIYPNGTTLYANINANPSKNAYANIIYATND